MSYRSLFALAALAACSPDATGPTIDPSTQLVAYSMAATVAPGTEVHKCQFVVLPADKAYLVAGTHHYTPGSHHLLLFRTDLTTIPPGMEGVADCYEGAGGYMSHVRGVIYGSQVPDDQVIYPPGVGLPLAARAVFLLQSHYLNATEQAINAKVDLKLTISDGTGIVTNAGVLFYYDPFIHVPPLQTGARAQMRCGIPSAITLFTAASHYHKRGVDYTAYLDPPDGTLSPTPFYATTSWDHPAPLGAPLTIAAGSRLRFSCGYDTSGENKAYYQGQSAADDEMCVFSGAYYPAMSDSDNLCMHSADMFGTGKTGCLATLGCARQCPGQLAPDLGANGQADVDPCWQRCIADSCPTTTTRLFDLQRCAGQSCATECADSGSSACQTCAQSKCPTETLACVADSCQ